MSSQGIVVGLTNYSQSGLKMIVPVVMSGIIAIYGLVVSVLFNNSMNTITTIEGIKILCGGAACGLSGLVCGYAVGVVGMAYTSQWNEKDGNLFMLMIITLIFCEVIGIYGMIIAVLLH